MKNTSKRRQRASRANGALSRGPVTPQGKQRSHTHAIRHGLLAKCIVLSMEDPEVFTLLMRQIEDRFAPVDEVELGMIEEMAACYWRMRRGWSIEAELLNKGLSNQPPGDSVTQLADAFTDATLMPQLALLQRYEARLHRMYQRALNTLIRMREIQQTRESTEQPNPISGQPEIPPQTSQSIESEPLSAMSPTCSGTTAGLVPQPLHPIRVSKTARPARNRPGKPGDLEKKPAA